MRSQGPVYWLIMTLFVAFCLAPFLWLIITSLSSDTDIARIPPLLPAQIVFDHYPAVFTGRPFARFLLNSLVVASATTLFCLAVGSLAAYALAKLEFRGKGLILGMVLMVSMFPPIATVSPLYKIMAALGLRDTWIALIFPYTTFAMPLTMWVLTNFFREIPDELGKAARMDGCTPWQAFRQVVFPLAAPGLFTTAILVFIAAWNEFLFALTFTSTAASRTVPVGIALFPGLEEFPWGDIAAASVIVTLPLVVMVLLFQRRIVAGLTAGALKG